ncbi:hypothetical protein PSH28_26585 [Pseudomonas resinovorans]|uniref:hypothetical protein n=1 Tax=Metapseudomonas resinovorans TaxID=53412 RepID=UPI00237F6798|nr:hypothetical protein [Pseudomonas resinovorans]MDE3740184.1 hypothetical protein [Pseudomonas resinovorans]
MKVEKVLLRSGRRVSSRDIYSLVSSSLFQSKLHYEVCELMAGQHCTSKLVKHVIENLYSSKSRRIRVVSALIWFVEYWQDDIEKIFVLEDVANILVRRGVCESKIEVVGEWRSAYIEKKFYFTLIVKAFANRIYSFLSKPIPHGSVIVRGWVEVTASMYSSVLESAELRVFPFPYGVKRQARFVRDCKRKSIKCSLDGLPYSIVSAVCLFFMGKRADKAMALIECEAYHNYARKLLMSKPKSIFTSDEFEAGAVAMYSLLIEAGVSVTNTAHGVGLYCPHVAYTSFKGFTLPQGEFYAIRNPDVDVGLRSQRNIILPLQRAEDAICFAPAFVLIHQNFEDYECLADAAALREVAGKVSEVSRNLGINFYVKIHPNTPVEAASGVAKKFGGAPVLKWEELDGVRPIFITINSTTFFDTRGYGPMLVYTGPSFHPELYFGNDFFDFTIDDLEGKLENLLQPNKWLEAAIFHRGDA